MPKWALTLVTLLLMLQTLPPLPLGTVVMWMGVLRMGVLRSPRVTSARGARRLSQPQQQPGCHRQPASAVGTELCKGEELWGRPRDGEARPPLPPWPFLLPVEGTLCSAPAGAKTPSSTRDGSRTSPSLPRLRDQGQGWTSRHTAVGM